MFLNISCLNMLVTAMEDDTIVYVPTSDSTNTTLYVDNMFGNRAPPA